jgi:2,3-bisphosphoglycerate-independent phosphoglycerate mutase
VKRPVCLIVLDGFGLGEGGPGDATALADAPFFERANRLYPRSSVETSGRAVGLPDGQMGNSEVGHMTLGAGRIIDHDLIRVQRAVDTGELARNPVLQQALAAASQAHKRLHLMGLISDGGVHSSLGHLDGILDACSAAGVKPILHAFTDGRDTPPQSALTWIGPLEERLARLGGCISTVSGRYFAMDRDRRWDRVATAYRAIVLGQGERATSAVEAIEKSYARERSDEFVEPVVIADGPPIADGDSVLHLNFRADRARELTNAITRVFPDELGPEVQDLTAVRTARFTCLAQYDERFGLPVMFEPVDVPDAVGALVSRAGLSQLRIAETEKYAHVTYFFNGGIEPPFEGEDRILVPSPTDVATYDLKPEMSAVQVTDELCAALARKDYAFVLANYANPDMVGHTGIVPAGVRAVEVVDACLDRLCAAVLARGGCLLITADHGNIEQLVDAETGQPHTAHTTNPVPLWWIADDDERTLADGGLADLAPTLLELLELEQPARMTGRSLLRCSGRSSSS